MGLCYRFVFMLLMTGLVVSVESSASGIPTPQASGMERPAFKAGRNRVAVRQPRPVAFRSAHAFT